MSLTVRDYYGVNIVVPTRETLEVLLVCDAIFMA